MILPNELLLDTLKFSDYKTLVLAKLAAARFLRIATKFTEELARHRSFRAIFYSAYVTYNDVTFATPATRILYDSGSQPSIAAACLELHAVIGPHSVFNLIFTGNILNMAGIGVIFEAAPALKCAENVDIYWSSDTTNGNNPDAFLNNFSKMKALCLGLDYDVFRQLGWTFLRMESARELLRIKVSVNLSASHGSMNDSVLELVRYCVTFPHLLGGVALELDFSENTFSGVFGQRIIELLKDSGRELTFRMRTTVLGELILDGSDYTFDVHNTTIRYTSKKSAIVVEVNGCQIAIQSTGEVPRNKPRTSGEVLPVIPSSSSYDKSS